MSVKSRSEYVTVLRRRYHGASDRVEKSRIIGELVNTLGYHRKHAVRTLNAHSLSRAPVKRRKRSKLYVMALPAIAAAWEALDYCCAERLHPVLLDGRQLEHHGEISVELAAYDDLRRISRTTLGRRLAEMPSPKFRRVTRGRKTIGAVRSEVPLGAWLNQVYALLDPYANLFLPTRKLVAKERIGSRVRKSFDMACTPFRRCCLAEALDPETRQTLEDYRADHSPLALHRQLEALIAAGPAVRTLARAAD